MNNVDVVCLQHEYGIFGGQDGAHILKLIDHLRMPVVTTLHTVLQEPSTGQMNVMKRIADALRDAGVEDVFRHAMLFDPELCDDCGAPLFPDRSGDAVHAELPDDAPTQQPLFH